MCCATMRAFQCVLSPRILQAVIVCAASCPLLIKFTSQEILKNAKSSVVCIRGTRRGTGANGCWARGGCRESAAHFCAPLVACLQHKKTNCHVLTVSNAERNRVTTASMPAAARQYYILHVKDLRMLACFLTLAVGQVMFDVYQLFIERIPQVSR